MNNHSSSIMEESEGEKGNYSAKRRYLAYAYK